MVNEKILTKEEIAELQRIKSVYDIPSFRKIYERKVREYLEQINYEERLAEYLKDKWYIKLLKFFFGNKTKE